MLRRAVRARGLIECREQAGGASLPRLCLSGKERGGQRGDEAAPGADVEACAQVLGDRAHSWGCRWSDWARAEWQRPAQVSAVPRIDAAVSVHLLPFCSAQAGRLRAGSWKLGSRCSWLVFV